jgi:4-coumarate--CoA ligase
MMVSQVWISSQVAREWAIPRVLSGELVPSGQQRTLAHLPAAHIAGVAGYFVAPRYCSTGRITARMFADFIAVSYYKLFYFFSKV